MIDFTQADALLSEGKLPEARAAYLQLAKAAVAADDKLALVRCLALSAEISVHLDQVEQAKEHLTAAEGVGQAIGNPGVTAGLLQVRGLVCGKTGDWNEAIRAYTKLEQIATEELDNPALAFEAMMRQGHSLLQAGSAEDALEEYQSSIQFALQKNPAWLIPAFNNVGITLRYLQRFEEALEYFHRALGAAEKFGEPNHLRIAKLEFACALADAGQIDEARKGLQQMAGEFAAAGEDHMVQYAHERLQALPAQA